MQEKRKILLIDDSEITLAMEKAVLEARGYLVKATSTLLEFEQTLQNWRPDLILTDIHMPEAKGTDIHTYGQAVFFSTVQVLTVSSSLKNPLTVAGRVLDVVLELWAVFVITAVAGSFASFFHSGDASG